MSINISNCTFTNCGTGIKAPSTTHMNLSNNSFFNVGKCHDFYSETHIFPSTSKQFQSLSKNALPYSKQSNYRDEHLKFLKVIRLLFNLEHQAKMDNNQQHLRVIRRLKGLVGNKLFDDLFAMLNR